MFGMHVSKTNKLTGKSYDTLGEAAKNDNNIFCLDAIQIYTHGPKSTKLNDFNLSRCPRHIKIYIHSSYVSMGLWNRTPNKFTYMRSEFRTAASIGAHGVVIHLKSMPAAEIHDILLEMYKLYKFTVPLLLETPAAKYSTEYNYSHVQTLLQLINMLPAVIPWGICVDTSHLWASGVRNSTYDEMKSWFDSIHHVKLIHLNANLVENFGTGKDIHIIPFSRDDGIWTLPEGIREAYRRGKCVQCCVAKPHCDDVYPCKDCASCEECEKVKDFYIDWDNVSKKSKDELMKTGVAYIVEYAKKNKIACICEINRGDIREAQFFRCIFSYLVSMPAPLLFLL